MNEDEVVMVMVMVTVTFIEPGGLRRDVAVEEGFSVMEAARKAGIAGVAAECGGACSCATCHVYIDPAWYEAAPQPEDAETDLLDFADAVRETSRLSCQIKLTSALDGLVVHVPDDSQ